MFYKYNDKDIFFNIRLFKSMYYMFIHTYVFYTCKRLLIENVRNVYLF